MRRAAPLAIALLLLADSAGAQQPGVQAGEAGAQRAEGERSSIRPTHTSVPGIPDVPSGPGTLRGRIVHATRPEAAADLPVVLYALPPDGRPGLRGGVADERGEFVFENLSNDPATPYLVGVSFADVPFGTRVAFTEGQTERGVVVNVSDPSRDVAAATLGEARLRFERGCGALRVIESHAVGNPTRRVIAVPTSERDGSAPVFETGLPPDAIGFAAAPGAQGVESDAARVRFWGPLYPGSQAVEFAYALPFDGDRVEVRRQFFSGAARVVAVTHPEGPVVRSDVLRAGEPLDEDGRTWRTASVEDVAPGTTLAFALELPPAAAGADGLSLVRAQMWLELDEAALKVDERYELETRGDAPLRAASDAPLLCVPLPDGAQELRFSTASLAMGLSHDASGALALRGPLPAGSSNLALSYLLPTDAAQVTLARRFPLALPLLSIYVADTGIVAESPRLHQRRPVLTDDRTFVQLEAFEIAAGEAVPVSLRPLPAARRPPRLAVAAFVVLAAAAALAFLATPLRGPARAASGVGPGSTLERESIYAAIHDLDHDFETGKLAEEDYDAFRRELRGRAVALLREEQKGSERPAPEAAPATCPRCAAPVAAGARFCSQCGAPLGAGGATADERS